MKLAARLTNERGKVLTLAANERLDIEIILGNRTLASLNIRETMNGWGIFDEKDHTIKRLQGTRTGTP